MFLKKDKRSNGKTYLSIIKGYRDPVSKKIRHKVVKNIGYLEDYYDKYDNPMEYFKNLAKKMTEEEKINGPMYLDMEYDEKDAKNLGFVVISYFYHRLKIDEFWNSRQNKRRIKFNLNQIFQALVYMGILNTTSKSQSFNILDKYFFDYGFSLHDVYRAMSIFNYYKEDFLTYVHENVHEYFSDDISNIFEDISNYYFQFSYGEKSKDDYLLNMGLLMDEYSIPISFNIEKEDGDFLSHMKERDNSFKPKNILLLNGQAVNTKNKMVYKIMNGGSYILSKSLIDIKGDLKDFILDFEGYERIGEGQSYKSRTLPVYIFFRVDENRRKRVRVNKKQIVLWPKELGDVERILRDGSMEEKIGAIEKNRVKLSRGSYEYIKTSLINYGDKKVLKEITTNTNRKKQEPMKNCEGPLVLLTSEVEMDDMDIIENYKKLSRIKEVFNITKDYLEERPQYLSREDRIESNLLVSFVCLTIIRLLSFSLRDTGIKVREALEELREIKAGYLGGNYYILYRDTDLTRALGDLVGVDFSKRVLTLREIKSIVARVKEQE